MSSVQQEIIWGRCCYYLAFIDSFQLGSFVKSNCLPKCNSACRSVRRCVRGCSVVTSAPIILCVNHVCLFRHSVSSSWSTRFNLWDFGTRYVEGNADKYWQCQNVLTPHCTTFFKKNTWFFQRVLTLIIRFAWLLAHLKKIGDYTPVCCRVTLMLSSFTWGHMVSNEPERR